MPKKFPENSTAFFFSEALASVLMTHVGGVSYHIATQYLLL
ncbi:hypothetical protein DLM_3272 [Aquitalea magnusonii]|uniref:Uncharacterized protein n=1 Tax=Aquitalea magnusonii TaxID=332411 RepID=A0A3G9GHM4_9NEIS|nr:hypothetical protein DLM_3272 [Aquitalea magnusonii]